jgi:hypothetical protein
MADDRAWFVDLALAIALAAAVALTGLLFLDWRELTCEEWQAKEREFTASGGYGPFADHFEEDPGFTEEQIDRSIEGLRELLETQPDGCEPE